MVYVPAADVLINPQENWPGIKSGNQVSYRMIDSL